MLLLLPGEFWIRGMAALGGLLLGMFYSVAYMPEAAEHRVKQAGYPVGTATAVREEAARVREAGGQRPPAGRRGEARRPLPGAPGPLSRARRGAVTPGESVTGRVNTVTGQWCASGDRGRQ